MNRKAQEINIAYIFYLFIALIFMSVAFQVVRDTLSPPPTCDYTSYQTNITSCTAALNNASAELQERPVVYINNTIYVPQYKDAPVVDIASSYVILIPSIIVLIILSIKLHLVKIEVRVHLPQEIQDEIKRCKKIVKVTKWIILGLCVLLVVKLVILIATTV